MWICVSIYKNLIFGVCIDLSMKISPISTLSSPKSAHQTTFCWPTLLAGMLLQYRIREFSRKKPISQSIGYCFCSFRQLILSGHGWQIKFFDSCRTVNDVSLVWKFLIFSLWLFLYAIPDMFIQVRLILSLEWIMTVVTTIEKYPTEDRYFPLYCVDIAFPLDMALVLRQN